MDSKPSSLLLNVSEVKKTLAGNKPHYVYILCRPDGRPFYVGKGVNLRVLQHEADART